MTVASTIGTSQDYATIALWEAAIPANATEPYVGTCMVDETYADQVIFNVANSGGHVHELDVDFAVRHGFTSNAGARVTGSGNKLFFRTPKLRVNNLATYTTAAFLFTFHVDNAAVAFLEFNNCHFAETSGSNYSVFNITNGASSATIAFKACGFDSDGSTTLTLTESNSGKTVSFTNCSINVHATTCFGGSMGSGTDNPVAINNCKILGSATTWFNAASGMTCTGANNVLTASSAWTGITAIATSQAAADHYTTATIGAANLSINASLDKSSYIGGDDLAGATDAEGDAFVASYCDTGCDAESAASAGGTAQPCVGSFFSSFGSFGRMGG